MWVPQDNVQQPLYVVTSIFNPVRFKSRWKLYRDFQRHVRESGAILVTIEAAFGERTYALEAHARDSDDNDAAERTWRSHGPPNVPVAAGMPASREGQNYIKVRAGQQQEIWLKENLQNIAVQHLPEDAKYILFCDADVQFTRPDWVSEILHALQHYHVVQPFAHAINLSPDYAPLESTAGFAYCHVNGIRRQKPGPGDYGSGASYGVVGAWHPGFCWAWRREALDLVGGLIEHGILGAGDNHMARALVGRAEESLNHRLSAGYRNRVLHWQRRAVEHIKGNIGYIDGTLLHHWHGRIVNRRYLDRWKLLINHGFDPDHDLKKDWRGVIALTDKKPKLRDDIRRYFRARSEDSIDATDADYRLVGAKPSWSP